MMAYDGASLAKRNLCLLMKGSFQLPEVENFLIFNHTSYALLNWRECGINHYFYLTFATRLAVIPIFCAIPIHHETILKPVILVSLLQE
jgi:hypothetical protein